MFELDGLDHVALTVGDVERAAAWYVEVLGFERRFPGMWDGVPTFVGLGLTAIALFPAKDNESNPRPGAMIEHVALRASRQNFAVAQARLQSHSNSRITKFHIRSTFRIPTATSSRLPPTKCSSLARVRLARKFRSRGKHLRYSLTQTQAERHKSDRVLVHRLVRLYPDRGERGAAREERFCGQA